MKDASMKGLDRETIEYLLTASGDVGLLLDPTGDVCWCADPWARLGSVDQRPTVIGQRLTDLLVLDDKACGLPDLLAQASAGRRRGPWSVRLAPGSLAQPAPRGRQLPRFQLTLTAAVPPDGEAPTVLALLRPLDQPDPPPEVVQDPVPLTPGAEEDARAGADRARSLITDEQLLELIPGGVAIISQEGRILFVNLYGANQFGYRMDELIGRWIVDLVAPEDRQHAMPALLRSEVQPADPARFRLLRADGGLAIAELRGQIFLDRLGRRNTIVTLRDITAEAQRQDRLKHQRVEEAITVFARGLAGELGLLLDDLGGTLQQCASAMEAPAPLTPRFLMERVTEKVNRGRAIASRLQTIGGISAQTELAAVQLNQIVEQVEQELRQELGPTIRLRTALAPDLLPIQGSMERVKSIVLQLCRNARQAMPLGGHLLLRTDNLQVDDTLLYDVAGVRSGHFSVLTVQDDGIGIDPEYVDRVFEPYFTTHGAERSSGLGLALVQAILREHRGFSSLESQPGRGTRIRGFFPQLIPADPCKAKVNSTRLRGNEVLLLVDDQEGIRPSLQPMLSQVGYRVFVVGMGAATPELLQRHQPLIQVAIVDLADPDGLAPDLLHRLRRFHPQLRFVVIGDPTTLRPLLAFLPSTAFRLVPRRPEPLLLHSAIRQLLDRQED